MSIFLEITQLENGDIVLREAEDDNEDQTDRSRLRRGAEKHGSTAKRLQPLVRISFSDEVRDMLGGDLVGVAEAMIDAATDCLGGETLEVEAEEADADRLQPAPVIH